MYKNSAGELNIPKIVAHAILGLIVLVILFGSFGTIGAGEVGVRTRLGKVVGQVGPGLYFKIPFIENIHSMDTQTQKDQTDATAASNDLQSVTATVAVNYHVEAQDASSIYANLGSEYADRVISPAIQESVKSVTANYTAEQLITEREKVREDIITLLTTKLDVYGVKVDSLNIVDFKFSETFNQAIEAKVTAQQNALAAKNKLDQVTYEAQQTVTTAKAQAEAIQIQAQAISQQGGANFVAKLAVDKWNGEGCVSSCFGSNTQVPVPFFNINK